MIVFFPPNYFEPNDFSSHIHHRQSSSPCASCCSVYLPGRKTKGGVPSFWLGLKAVKEAKFRLPRSPGMGLRAEAGLSFFILQALCPSALWGCLRLAAWILGWTPVPSSFIPCAASKRALSLLLSTWTEMLRCGSASASQRLSTCRRIIPR